MTDHVLTSSRMSKVRLRLPAWLCPASTYLALCPLTAEDPRLPSTVASCIATTGAVRYGDHQAMCYRNSFSTSKTDRGSSA